MTIWRRYLLPAALIIAFAGAVFYTPPANATSKDELLAEYNRQSGLKWLCDNADKMTGAKGSGADDIMNYFPRNAKEPDRRQSASGGGNYGYGGGSTSGDDFNYTAGGRTPSSIGDVKGSLNKLIGETGKWDDAGFVRQFMNDLGYTWKGDVFTPPAPGTICSKAASKYNGGKKPDLTTGRMKWAETTANLHKYCTVERLGKPDDIRISHGDKLALAKNGNKDDKGRRYVIINEIVAGTSTTEEIVYGLEGKSVSTEKCVEYANTSSAGAKPAAEEKAKATTEVLGNAAGKYVAEELCRPLKTANPGDYDRCISDTTASASQCFASHGENVSEIQKCLRKKHPGHANSITEDLIKKALDAAKASLPGGASSGSAEEGELPCAISGIGWIVCPMMNFVATVNDSMFDLVSSLLATRPNTLLMDDSNPTYAAWGTFRNMANVSFVLIFLVVIFSQITSQGISNYGIKRILPRLIIGAILINASFIVSALATDISNILGSSLKSLLEQAAPAVQTAEATAWVDMMGKILGGGLVAGAAAAALWAIGIPGAIAFFVAMLVTLLILIGRQAGIILLIVLSPLAFASLMLPNTEKWFKKWVSMFGGLLMVFPIISLLFGAGSFAATVLGQNSDTSMKIAALVVTALPLIATPMLLKKSMNSLGSIGQVASSMTDKIRGKTRESVKSSGYMKHREKLQARKRAQIQSGTYEGRGGRLNPSNWRTGINRWRNRNSTFNAITGGYGDKLNVLGASVAAAQDKEEMEAANASVSSMNLDGTGLMNLIKDGKDKNGNQVTDHQRRAAMQQLAPIMTGREARQLASLSINFNDDMRKEAAAAVRTAAPKAPWLGGRTLAEIQAGTFDESTAMNRYMQEKMSAEDFNTMDAASIDALGEQARDQASRGNTDPQRKLKSAKEAHSRSVELTSKISTGNRDALSRI